MVNIATPVEQDQENAKGRFIAAERAPDSSGETHLTAQHEYSVLIPLSYG